MKKLNKIAALMVFLPAAFILIIQASCRSPYELVVTDTKRTEKEKNLLAKACHEEFPVTTKYIEGKTVYDTTFIYDDEVIEELSLIIDSLLVQTQKPDPTVRPRYDVLLKKYVDSMTQVVKRMAARPCITSVRIDTAYQPDSAMIRIIKEDLLICQGESLEKSIKLEDLEASEKKARKDRNDWIWYFIISNTFWVAFVFRKRIWLALSPLKSVLPFINKNSNA